MSIVFSLGKILLQAPPPVEERVIPTIVIAVIIGLLLLGWSAMKKNKGGLAAGALLVIGAIFAYFRYLSPYSTDLGAALAGKTVLFNIGDYGFTTGALGAIIALIIVIALLAWYRKQSKRT